MMNEFLLPGLGVCDNSYPAGEVIRKDGNMVYDADVVVAGAGFAGLASSLAAARNGAKVILVERYGFLGGTATAGLVHHFDPVNIIEATGISKEIYDELKKRGALKEFPIDQFEIPFSYWQGGSGFDPEDLKNLALKMVLKENIKCLFHTSVVKVDTEGQRITSVICSNKSGMFPITAKVFVDATGDADMAARAGVDFEMGDEKGICMSPTLAFRVGGVETEKILEYFDQNPSQIGNHPRIGKYIRDHRNSIILQGFYDLIKQARDNGDLDVTLPETGIGMTIQPRYGEFHVNATRVNKVDAIDGDELSMAEITERQNVEKLFCFMKKYLPGFEGAYMLQTADQVGIRESRRIKGKYVLTIDDIRSGFKFPDAVVRGKWAHTDKHSGESMQWSFEFIEGPYYVPYRSLISSRIENILVAGRCISATRDAMASIRIMPVCAQIGEAAGTAAAICCRMGAQPVDLEYEHLGGRLIENGVCLD